MRALVPLLAVLLAGCVLPAEPPADAPAASPSVAYEALVVETSLGAFTAVLYPDAAPETVALMKAYVAEGYYRGREFARTVPGHVIQVSERMPTAASDDRRVPLEAHPAYHFSAGALGIARGEDPNSGGPSFFVMDFATSHLDGNYTVWGQVVGGMDVVHVAARVPAVDFRPHSAVPFLLTDRMAIDPPRIVDVRLVTVLLPAEEAARLPLAVAQNARAGEYRHSLEWPADLATGRASDLAWYVRPHNNTPPPEAASVRVRVAGEDLPVEGDPTAPGAFAFRWTPPRAGEHEATLVVDGRAVASLVVVVPSPRAG